MCIEEPKVAPEGVYCVKATCAVLEICRVTLHNRRRKGLITPLNPDSKYGYKYSGAEIIRFWRNENYLNRP